MADRSRHGRAVPPVSRCQRSMITSTKIGSSSITTGATAGPFRRNQGRPGAAEGIKDQAATVGAVTDRVRDHGHRLDGRVQSKLALLGPVQCVLADIVPDIGPVPPMTSRAPHC